MSPAQSQSYCMHAEVITESRKMLGPPCFSEQRRRGGVPAVLPCALSTLSALTVSETPQPERGWKDGEEKSQTEEEKGVRSNAMQRANVLRDRTSLGREVVWASSKTLASGV